MKSVAPIVLNRLAKFRVLTIPQLLILCNGVCKKTALYKALDRLKDNDLAYRICHQKETLYAYTASEQLLSQVYEDFAEQIMDLRIRDLKHTVMCSEVMISLARRERITGIALEHELSTDAVNKFCYSRRPDGIIRLNQGDQSIELAVEIERSFRTIAETKKILDHYNHTLQNRMLCTGVILVAPNAGVFNRYRECITELPETTRKRIILCASTKLTELKSDIFGAETKHAEKVAELVRKEFASGIEYVPMKSVSYVYQPDAIPHIYGDSISVINKEHIS
jgi:hypothetical protein